MGPWERTIWWGRGKGYLQRGSAGASLFLPQFITLYNLEGRGYLHRGSAGGQDISAALYNTIQSGGGGGLSPQRFSWGQDISAAVYNTFYLMSLRRARKRREEMPTMRLQPNKHVITLSPTFHMSV